MRFTKINSTVCAISIYLFIYLFMLWCQCFNCWQSLWGWNKSPFDINSVVFHFDDFNYGRRSQPYLFWQSQLSWVFFITYNKIKKIYSTLSEQFQHSIVVIGNDCTGSCRINIKWWLVSTSFKIYLDILSNLYIMFTIFYYNTISFKCTFCSCSS
jgi:hypothetical protein